MAQDINGEMAHVNKTLESLHQDRERAVCAYEKLAREVEGLHRDLSKALYAVDDVIRLFSREQAQLREEIVQLKAIITTRKSA